MPGIQSNGKHLHSLNPAHRIVNPPSSTTAADRAMDANTLFTLAFARGASSLNSA